MKSQSQKASTDEGKAKTQPGTKTSPQVKHPILRLQQMVGNKAVAKMIQRQQHQPRSYFHDPDDPGGGSN